jgi:hypothetical protein
MLLLAPLFLLLVLSIPVYGQGSSITDQSSPGGQQKGNEMLLSYEKTGYNVYLDGNYVGTDGTNGDALDGNFIIHDIPCWGTHTIVVDDGEFTHTLDYPFDCGTPYSIYVGDPLFVVGRSHSIKGQLMP